MNGSHYLWPLFSPEKEDAQQALRMLWRKHYISTTQAAHWALNLGDKKWVTELKEVMLSNESSRNDISGIDFRLAREKRQINPYETLLTQSMEDQGKIIQKATSSYIRLSGGIGDHIEDLSILLPVLKRGSNMVKLITTKQRKKQFQSLWRGVEWSADRNESDNSIHSKQMMAALGIFLPKPKKIINTRESHSDNNNSLICCWTAAGEGDILSRWIRSVPFNLVIVFYEELLSNGWKADSITDSSNWKPWESKILEIMGIRTYKPERHDINSLVEEVSKKREVISIDTALAHLCAAMGKQVRLLLPLHCDERWNQLVQEGTSYERTCQITRQQNYGKWEREVEKLLMEIVQHSV